MRTKFGLLCLSVICWVCLGQTGAAENYPSRPVRMIVPSAAGGCGRCQCP